MIFNHVIQMKGPCVGILDTGYPGPPAPGPLQRPSFGPGVNRRPKPNKEDPHEEAPREENDD
jgi:hypothetical protein